MATVKITGPKHPLLARIDEGDTWARKTYLPLAQAVYADHGEHGISDQTVYEITGAASWRRIGPAEDHGHLLTQGGYVAVRTSEWPGFLARRLAETFAPDRVPGSWVRAKQLRDVAYAASPMVGVLLAVCHRAGLIEWDTGESIAAAGRRLALDAAWRALPGPNPVLPRPGGVFALAAAALGLVDRPAVDYARTYLTQRADIDAHLAEHGIEWGGTLLPGPDAAARVKTVGATWRSYVSRGEAPAPDEESPARWRLATLDAWRLVRPRAVATDW
jgi:hypothetical protein